MAVDSIFRNINILSELTSETAEQVIDIYTPGLLSPYDIVSGVKYSGFITSLKMVVNIKSVAELVAPDSNLLDSDEITQIKQKEALLATPRKAIALFLRNSNTQKPILIGEILLFNRFPYYYVSLIKYFSDTSTFDVAPDTVISCQVKEVGYGLLEDEDRISIIGSAVEESPSNRQSQPINIVVNVNGVETTANYLLNNNSAIGNSFLLGD